MKHPANRIEPPAANKGKAAGFTLIELLAVIAVILILVALLFPGLQTVRDRAETVVCISKLMQIMNATQAYAMDHEGTYPDCWRWVYSDQPPGGDWHYTWVEWAQPETVTRGALYEGRYLVDERAYLCPAFKRVYGLNPAFSHLTPHVGYAMNQYLWSARETDETSWNGLPKLKRSQIEKPSELGVYADEGTIALDPWGPVWINNLCIGVGVYKNPSSFTDSIAAFHNAPGGDPTKGVGNVVCGDGHVETVHPSRSKEIMTPWNYKQ